ncbi:hypothetical protein [Paenibacillus macerans]|uniref:hypothetical protein n=1 Tax=Paenibacillus macerans TaxID=44252 RepID=UPI003D31203C
MGKLIDADKLLMDLKDKKRSLRENLNFAKREGETKWADELREQMQILTLIIDGVEHGGYDPDPINIGDKKRLAAALMAVKFFPGMVKEAMQREEKDFEKRQLTGRRDWKMDKKYLEKINEREEAPDDEDLYKIASYWHSETEKWRIEAFKKYPTPDAYEAACKALHKHKARADSAELWEEKLRDEIDGTIPLLEASGLLTRAGRLKKLLTSLYPDKERKA